MGQEFDSPGTLRSDRPPLPLACPWVCHLSFCASASHSVKWEELCLPPASTALKVESKECICSAQQLLAVVAKFLSHV